MKGRRDVFVLSKGNRAPLLESRVTNGIELPFGCGSFVTATGSYIFGCGVLGFGATATRDDVYFVYITLVYAGHPCGSVDSIFEVF